MAPLPVRHLNCASIRRLSGAGRHLVAHVLLIETPRAGLVLVDTGLGTADYAAIASRLGPAFAFGFAHPLVDQRLSAVHQLRALGYDPADVRHILITHLDLDHTGGLSDFPQAQVHVHERELAWATARSTWLARSRYRPAMWAHGPRWSTFTHSAPATTRPAPATDWFGLPALDPLPGLPAEIRPVPLPGHTPGHTGYAVASDEGWLLHAGDAYFDAHEIKRPDRSCPADLLLFERFNTTDRQRMLSQQAQLRRLSATHPEVSVFSAHCPDEFPGDPFAALD